MKQLKIFALLTCLKREEINSLLLYVEYCEKEAGREYIPLLKEILRYYPYFSGKHISLNKLYSTLYPGRVYNNRVIISRLSELNKLVENFLIKVSLEKTPHEKELLLAEELLSRNQFKLFNSLSEKLLDNLTTKHKLGPSQLLAKERLMNKTGRSLLAQRQTEKMIHHIHENVKVFTTFALTNTLSMVTGLSAFQPQSAKNANSIVSASIDDNMILNTIRVLKKTDPAYSSYIELWYLAYRFYTMQRDDKAYFDFVELFYRNINNFDRVTLQLMFMLMYAYCVMQDKNGRKEFRKDLYSVLKDIIHHEAYQPLENEFIPALLFREVVRTGIKEGDLSWVESFINKNHTKLEPSISQNMYNYGYGFLEAHKNNYESALNYLSKSKSDVLIIEIDIRLLLQITYFELELYDQAKNISLSNSQFVKSKKVSNKEHYKIVKNFNEFYLKLLRAKMKNKILFDPTVLVKDIENRTPLYFKSWFLQKVNEMITQKQ